MGCAVIWSYLELFGSERLSRLVLVDQMPRALREPDWSDGDALEAGATLPPEGLFAFTAALRGAGPDPRIDFVHDTTSNGIADDDLARIIDENLLFDRSCAADLILDVATHDWRRLIPSIDLPTQVVAGNSPNVPVESQRWISEHIAGSSFAVVEGVSGGTHFPFIESADEFNDVVGRFLTR